MNDPLLTRFFRYLTFDCQTKSRRQTSPSNAGQRALAVSLEAELHSLGMAEITLNDDGVLSAVLPATGENKPTMGWLVNLATSSELSTKGVTPEIIPCYRGGDIALGDGKRYISPVQFPFLHQLHEHTLIIGDGKHGLGAESKAAIALVMTALAHLQTQTERHCHLRVAFVPDNAAQLSATFFNQFYCDVLYSVQAEGIGRLAVENMNTQNLALQLTGNDDGNVLEYGCVLQHHFSTHIPHGLTLLELQGNTQQVKMRYRLSAQDKTALNTIKSAVHRAVEHTRSAGLNVIATFSHEIDNMAACVQQAPLAIELVKSAVSQVGVAFAPHCMYTTPIGAYLSRFDIACPSLSIGGFNFGTVNEIMSLQGMQTSVQILVKLVTQA
ncbi:zinc-binding metallopeptidase family protein [Spirabiliibacterium falconis]|uniref:hypothetical protein n=1 Tax=Spirabiliibacterium falconis TaxID=572023 RepID=UPI001AAD723F|nr:hypothetical protein [Spirabiliibacterium falconis]MBE2893913.1 hypothetical protein [Spirabiliibacterium falconis]